MYTGRIKMGITYQKKLLKKKKKEKKRKKRKKGKKAEPKVKMFHGRMIDVMHSWMMASQSHAGCSIR